MSCGGRSVPLNFLSDVDSKNLIENCVTERHFVEIMIDPNLIIDNLLNQGESAKDGEKLFEMIDSDRVQAYLTELGLEKIRFFVKDLKGDLIAEEIVSDLLEVFQISPYFEPSYVYISNDPQNSDNNSHLVLSVNEFYQRYLLEKTL